MNQWLSVHSVHGGEQLDRRSEEPLVGRCASCLADKAAISLQDVPSNASKHPGVTVARTTADICHPGQEYKWKLMYHRATCLNIINQAFTLSNTMSVDKWTNIHS